MSRFSDAAFAVMTKRKVKTMSSEDMWKALREAEPEITAVTPTRKTPRTTAMRDIRKDKRFIVGNRKISLAAGD